MRLYRLLIAASFLTWMGSAVAIAKGDDNASLALSFVAVLLLAFGVQVRHRNSRLEE